MARVLFDGNGSNLVLMILVFPDDLIELGPQRCVRLGAGGLLLSGRLGIPWMWETPVFHNVAMLIAGFIAAKLSICFWFSLSRHHYLLLLHALIGRR